MESRLLDGAFGKGAPETSDAEAAVRTPCEQSELAFLAGAVAQLSSLPLRADTYRRIGDLVLDAVGNAAVAVQSYDAETGILEVRALVGVAGILDGILNALGGHPVGMTFPINEEARTRLGTGKLVMLPGGLQDLSFGVIPRSICHAIERLVNLRNTYVIGMSCGGDLLGSIAILPRGESAIPNALTLETLVRHASVVLQRRQVVAAYRESEARYRLLAEHATDVVWTSDLHVRFTYVSASVRHVFGYTPDEMMSIPLRQFLPPASLAAIRAALAEELALDRSSQRDHGFQRELELEAIRKDGTHIWVEVRAGFSRDPEGNPVGILGTTRDITDLKRREQERRDLDARAARTQRVRYLIRLAASIGRDLAASLEGASECAAAALTHLDLSSPARSPLERCHDASSRGLGLARRLLDSGRDYQPTLSEVDAGQLLERTLSSLSVRLPASVAVRGTAAKATVPVQVDTDALTEAFAALVAALTAALSIEEDTLRLRVEATTLDAASLARTYLDGNLAPGNVLRLEAAIPSPRRAEIDANELLDSALGSAGIAGLECAAALGVIRAHGGNLLLSRDPGKPLRVSLLLPRATVAGAQNPPAGGDDSGLPATGSVVVADADIGARWLAKSALEQAGLTVVTAETTTEAIEAVRRNPAVSVVLLDATLPPTGVTAALRDLRGARAGVKVVLSSPFGDEPARPTPGIAGFVQKPYLPKVLVAAVRKVMRD